MATLKIPIKMFVGFILRGNSTLQVKLNVFPFLQHPP